MVYNRSPVLIRGSITRKAERVNNWAEFIKAAEYMTGLQFLERGIHSLGIQEKEEVWVSKDCKKQVYNILHVL